MKKLPTITLVLLLFMCFSFKVHSFENISTIGTKGSRSLTPPPMSNPPTPNLVISEIMYNPPESGSDSLEYIEMYNAEAFTVYLDGYTFYDGISHTFSSGDTIRSGEFLVIAIDTTAIRHVFGYKAAFQWSSGALSNGGEDIVLHDAMGRTVDSVDYDNSGAWPGGSANGGGPSIELIDITTDNNLGANWMASLEETTYLINGLEVLGSPGYFPIELTLASTDIDCNGGANGTASATVNRGISPVTYNWSNSGNGNSISNLTAGTYTVTVTDSHGTTKIDSVALSEPTALAASNTVDSTVSCNGLSDGGATASASGGTNPYTYTWSNSATTASITGVTAGTYSVTITDNNGCTATNSAIITEPTAIATSTTVDSTVSCNSLSDGGATASATGGTTPYTYTWSNSATTASITGVTAGTYSVTITDNNGCTATNSAAISEPTVLVASTSVDSSGCSGLSNGGATASATGGTSPYTYLWSNSSSNAFITGVPAGSYTVTVTDNNGCTDTDQISISSNPTPSADAGPDVTICSGSAVTIGGSPTSTTSGVTYAWDNASSLSSATVANPIATPNVTTTYTVTVTTTFGCSIADQITVNVNPIPDADAGPDITICNSFGGTIGGSPTSTVSGATFAWDNAASLNNATIANPFATPTSPTTYTVTVTDGNGCTNTDQIVVSVTTLVASVVADSNVSCNGGADGGVTASASGGTAPFTYSWSNSSNVASITGLVANRYTVVIIDGNGCTDIGTGTITEPNPITINTTSVNTSCNGSADGSITTLPTGGTSPYTYNWSNSGTTATVSNLAAGTYTVTVTDNNSCTATNTTTITEPTAIVPVVTIDSNVSCNGLSDGGATTSATGGSSPYTYTWSNSATTASITGVSAGTYSITITDNNGCTATSTATITEPTAIVNTVSQNLATLTADQGGATYQWLDCNNGNAPISGETSQTFVATANGDYAVEITVNGCIDTSACINVTSVGFEELNQQEVALMLYPNPTKGDLNLSLEGASFQGERLRIFDLTGKVISEQIANGNLIQLDLHNFDSGVYFIEVGNQRKKVILTK